LGKVARIRIAMLVVGLALLGVAVATAANAPSTGRVNATPFADSSQVAADQYGGPTVTVTPPTVVVTATVTVNAPTVGSGRAVAAQAVPTPGTAAAARQGVRGEQAMGGDARAGTANGVSPVAVAATPAQIDKAKLPFTGLDLSVLVLLAIALIAAGLALRVAERVSARRRAAA
jgi:hypothetical protein